MLGETIDLAEIAERGVAGDRVFGVLESDSGLVASAKQPRKWGRLLQCRAARSADGRVTVTLPDATEVYCDDPSSGELLSRFAGRAVTVSSTPPPQPHLERAWPAVEDLAPPEVIERAGTVTPLAAAAPGTFFDYAPVHIVTTSSLRALRDSRPGVDFALERFRPNIVLDTAEEGFVENSWVGGRLVIGAVELEVATATPRCAVPSLAHGDLPAELEVLRGVVAANRIPVGNGMFACVGVYGRPVVGGAVRTGDPAHVVDPPVA